jgi:hypothetical protein
MRPFFVRERVGVEVQIVTHDGVEKQDVDAIRDVYLGVL